MTDENEKSKLEARMTEGLEDFLETNKIDENDAAMDAINETMSNAIDHKTIENSQNDNKSLDSKESPDTGPDSNDDSSHIDEDLSITEDSSITTTIRSMDANDDLDVSQAKNDANDNRSKKDDHDENDHANDEPSVWRQFFLSWRGVIAAVIIIAAIIIPSVWVELIKPAMDKKQLEQQTRESTAAIVPYAHKWEQVKLDASKTGKLAVNTKQWLLESNKTVDGVRTSCMVFHAKDLPETGHMAKVTLAFGDSKSRDFMNAQASTFETAMRQGKIDLQVCMLLTSDEYSAFAIETLGEVDFNDYTNTWEALKNLLKVDETSFTSADSRIKAALNAINNITDVDKKVNISSDSIKNGSFIQWSRIMTDANAVEKIPAFWLDGVNLSNQDKFNMDNPDAMWTKLNAL